MQYIWGGATFCWYDSAWNGPGFYTCGYAWRRGFGWGGPYGDGDYPGTIDQNMGPPYWGR